MPDIAKVLTFDEAWRITVNIAKLPGPSGVITEGNDHDGASGPELEERRLRTPLEVAVGPVIACNRFYPSAPTL